MTQIKKFGWLILSLCVVVAGAYAAQRLGKLNAVIEFPIWAVAIGLLLRNLFRIPQRLRSAAQSEWFIKTGIILLGASINLGVIMSVGVRGLAQALIVVPSVFLTAWFLAQRFGLDKRLSAVMATGASVCGVSAAIAAAGSVRAKKEHLTYIITLVVLFALPLMVIQPYIAKAIGLSSEVAGAWLGGNIDTTAAVVGAGEIHSEIAMKVASIVKMSQNVLIGFIAFLLAVYFTVVVERQEGEKPSLRVLWDRFPKFVFGFVALAVLASFTVFDKMQLGYIKDARTWAFALAFVSIGLELPLGLLRTVGGKPVVVFALVTVANMGIALLVAWTLFRGFTFA